MQYVVKIATLNINGITSKTRIGMLGDFLRRQDIDFALLQEVTRADLTTLRRYTAHTNIGTGRRRTAILAKEELVLSDIRRIPSGRGIAATYNGIRIINVYAPSGAEKRNARESFYDTEITSLLLSTDTEMIIAGDFNCVLSSADTTGRGNYSRALDTLTKGLGLKDAWESPHTRPTYTHYTSTGASRLDGIYVTENLRKNKKGVETVAAAFTDHLAVILRITLDIRNICRGRGYWKMNVSLLNEPTFRQSMQEEWTRWRNRKKYYPNPVL